MESIGVRELRQHASQHLARVAAGETLRVTDRGRPVALLVPVTDDPWDELVRSGRVELPAEGAPLGGEEPVDYGISGSAELARLRDDER